MTGTILVDVIHIHEDVWGMRNLYPTTVQPEVDKDVADAAAAAERNRAPSGFGYDDIYMINPPSQDYTDNGLTLASVHDALSPILPRVRRFNATIYPAMLTDEVDPLGAYEEDAWCFGTGPGCFVKIDAKGDLAVNIWFDLNTGDPQAAMLIRQAIVAIDKLVPSVIADYYLDFSAPVSDTDQLDSYFSEFAE